MTTKESSCAQACTLLKTKKSIKLSTIHSALVQWKYSRPLMYEHREVLLRAVNAAIKSAEEKYKVINNEFLSTEFDGFELIGDDITKVNAAANMVLEVLYRFKDVVFVED